jgi:Heparinase II/III-like protein
VDQVALDIPARRGGWWHEYVCPTHGVELEPADGDVFGCRYGCRWRGEPYSGAWAVLAHQTAARSLRRLAVTARAGHRGAAEQAVAGLTRYADLYHRSGTEPHPDAQPWMLAGRLFQQALTEAIWATSLAHAVHTLALVVNPARLAPAAELLAALRAAARDARARLVEGGDFRNNYTAWLNAAGASASRALALLGEPDETADWVTGPHGIAAHAESAVHPDGWEWEASGYYHVFVLRGYLLGLRGQPCDSLPDALVSRLRAMVDVVAALHTDEGGTLPALHDTPYAGPRWDDELYELCLLASGLPGAPSLRRLAEPLATRLHPEREDHWRSAEARGWFGLVDAEPVEPDRGSRLFPDAGYAVLGGRGYRAVLDFGPHGGSHGHLDKLALYLYGPTAGWQPAYGVPPYAHPLRRDYYTRTPAHPTLTVDGLDQREATGRLRSWHAGEGGRVEVGAAADVYDGVRFARHLRVEPDQLIDVVTVQADRDREFVLHLRTDVAAEVRHTDAGARTRWPGDGGLAGLHVSTPAAPLTSAPDLGPADDPQRCRPHLRWRVRGRRAVFASVYSTSGVPNALGIEQRDGLMVTVERGVGEPIRWRVPHQEVDRVSEERTRPSARANGTSGQ